MKLLEGVEVAGALGPKVLTVASEIKSSPCEIVSMARGVGEACRKLQGEGYDLRYCQIKAHLLRDDKMITPACDLHVSATTGKLVERAKGS